MHASPSPGAGNSQLCFLNFLLGPWGALSLATPCQVRNIGLTGALEHFYDGCSSLDRFHGFFFLQKVRKNSRVPTHLPPLPFEWWKHDMRMAFLDLNHHVESVYYQVSALSDYTLSYNFHQTHCRTNANSILVQVHTILQFLFPVAAWACMKKSWTNGRA